MRIVWKTLRFPKMPKWVLSKIKKSQKSLSRKGLLYQCAQFGNRFDTKRHFDLSFSCLMQELIRTKAIVF